MKVKAFKFSTNQQVDKLAYPKFILYCQKPLTLFYGKLFPLNANRLPFSRV